MRAGFAMVLVGCGFSPSVPSTSKDGGPSDAGSGTVFLDARVDGPCADDDNDGVCNAVDTWPCGEAPDSLGNQLVMTKNATQTSVTLSSITLDNVGRLVVAAPSATVAVKFHYAILDSACPVACIDQIEIGWAAPGNRTSCPFDSAVPNDGTVTAGDITSATIQVPATPGVYAVRANIGQNYSCGYLGATTWYGPAPGATQTLATVCVH